MALYLFIFCEETTASLNIVRLKEMKYADNNKICERERIVRGDIYSDQLMT